MKYTISDLELVVQSLRTEEQQIDVGCVIDEEFARIFVESSYCVAANVIQELIDKEEAYQIAL